MSARVLVVDYGVGNLHSVVKAFLALGAEVEVSGDPAKVREASRAVLPGVGAFGDGRAALRRLGLDEAVVELARRERPLLGICLGMQLLLSSSEEFGEHRGLGLVPGRVRAIGPRAGAKVPQVGWNRIRPAPGASWEGTALFGLEPGTAVYFVHSFTAWPEAEADRLADASYGGARIAAAIRRGPLLGLQFHPEKSGPEGLAILDRFLGS